MNTAAPAVPADTNPLTYVRQRLKDATTQELQRISLEAEVSMRTLYNIREEKRDTRYSTVEKLSDILKKADAAAPASK